MSSTNRIARQTALMEQALLWTVRGVNKGQAADRTLQNWFHQRKYLGSRDRRFIREAVFACWRRYGWLSQWEDAPIPKQAALAWRLQHGALPDPLREGGKDLPDLPGNLHDLAIDEQARILTDIGLLPTPPLNRPRPTSLSSSSSRKPPTSKPVFIWVKSSISASPASMRLMSRSAAYAF